MVKKISTSLLIYAGPRAYNFYFYSRKYSLGINFRMNNWISSTIWVQAYREVEYRFDDLLAHLENYGPKKAVAISEGATRVIARADNDNQTDTKE